MDSSRLIAERARQMNAEPDITEFLARATRGDVGALDALIPHVYATLRRLAHRQRAHESEHTLGTTALVHEAYLTMARNGGIEFSDRAHLYAYVSRVMRHILIDRARRNSAQKRQVPETTAGKAESDLVDVLALDEALSKLAAADERLARAAELRLFAGLSAAEIAAIIGVTSRTVERDWMKARTFLSGCLMPPA